MQERILVTKDKIYLGLIEELKLKPLTSLTDRDVIKTAHVSSGTFYKYFRNLTDALRCLENNFLESYTSCLKADLSLWHVEELFNSDKVKCMVESDLNQTFEFWNHHSEDLLILVSKNGEKYFYDKLISQTKSEIKQLLGRYSKIDQNINITSNKLKMDQFSEQVAVSEVTTLIWSYKHLEYLSRNDIRKSVAEILINSPCNLILNNEKVAN